MRTWSACALALGLASAAPLSSQSDPTSGPITRVDHFYAESGAMDVLLGFLKDDLDLPEAWPDQDYGAFATGAVSLGNVTFEVLRFGEPTGSGAARFAGIALEPEGDTRSLLEWLAPRGIDHGTPQPFPPEGPAFFETTALPALIPEGAEVFVCDYKDRQLILRSQAENRAILAGRNGGPLGLLGVEELLVESTDLTRSLEAWSALVARTHAAGDQVLVEFDSGPRIRIQRGESNRFVGISLLVRSLEEAEAFLAAGGLLGPRIDNGLSIDPEALGGLRILIVEG